MFAFMNFELPLGMDDLKCLLGVSEDVAGHLEDVRVVFPVVPHDAPDFLDIFSTFVRLGNLREVEELIQHTLHQKNGREVAHVCFSREKEDQDRGAFDRSILEGNCGDTVRRRLQDPRFPPESIHGRN